MYDKTNQSSINSPVLKPLRQALVVPAIQHSSQQQWFSNTLGGPSSDEDSRNCNHPTWNVSPIAFRPIYAATLSCTVSLRSNSVVGENSAHPQMNMYQLLGRSRPDSQFLYKVELPHTKHKFFDFALQAEHLLHWSRLKTTTA